MTSGTLTTPKPPPPVADAPDELEQFIERRLKETQRQIQRVDLASGVLSLLVGLLLWLLAASVIDHWLVFGGLGRFGRSLCWVLMIAAAAVHLWRKVIPPIARRISPIYVAHAIEQQEPSLKNSLINFLLLRRARQVVAPMVFYAVEDRAARDIAAAPIDAVPDWRRALRLGYLLAFVLALFCLYLVFSPKNPLVSAARVLLPWARIAAPTRATIEDVTPGNATAFLGDQIEVSAIVRGLKPGESARLHFSTADRQVLDQQVALRRDDDGLRFRTTIPPGTLGLQQDISYFITAGDCRTDTYYVRVRMAPTISVETIHYEYPKYTRLPPRTVAREGDIRAPLGTTVSIEASANYEILRAEIDLNCTGRAGVPMRVEGTKAFGRFTLRPAEGDPNRSEFESYQLRFTDKERRENPRPVRHRIEIVPDEPPEVEILSPVEEESVVAWDGRLEVEVRASDPDYGLKSVAVRAELDGQALAVPKLFEQSAPASNNIRQWQGKVSLEPRKLNLRPGQRVAFWAEAEDHREPSSNKTTTARRWLIVDAPPQRTESRQPDRTNLDNQEKLGEPRNAATQAGTEGATMPDSPQSGNETPDSTNKSENQQRADSMPSTNAPQATAQPQEAPNGPNADEAESRDSGSNNGASAQENSPRSGEKSEVSGNLPSEPIDPESQAGDAIERILDHRERQSRTENSVSQSNDSQPPSVEQPSQGRAGQGEQSPKATAGFESSASNEHSGRNPSTVPQTDPAQALQSQDEPSSLQPTGNQTSNGNTNSLNEQRQQPSADGSQSTVGRTPSTGNTPKSQPPASEKQSSDPAEQSHGSSSQQSEPQRPTGATPSSSAARAANVNRPPIRPQDQQGPSVGGQRSDGNGPPQSRPTENQADGRSPSQQQPPPGASNDSAQTGDEQKNLTPANHAQPSATQSGGQQAAPSPADSANRTNSSDTLKPNDLPDPSGTAGKTLGDKPQDAGTERPMRGSADPKPNDSISPSDQHHRREGQLTQPNESPGAGSPSQTPSSSPEAQSDNKTRPKDPQSLGDREGSQPDAPLSPSGSNKQSDSRGQTSGDQSGGGQQGGGQQARQPGQGKPGSGTDAESGLGNSEMRGPGEIGDRPGNDQGATRSENRSGGVRSPGTSGEQGSPQPSDKIGPQSASNSQKGTGGAQQPGGNGAAEKLPDQFSGKPGEGTPARIPAGGGGPTGSESLPPDSEPGSDAARLDFARRQTNLALEHLRNQLSNDRSDLLDRLGWTPEEARRFLENWERLQRAAEQPGPEQPAAKKKLDDALRSLGLRPRGTELRGSNTSDKLQGLRENIRFEPPREWADQVGDYQRAVAGGK